MPRHRLSDTQWVSISDMFPAPKRMGRPPRDSREILDAIFWIMRTGAPWRDLPEEYGPFGTAWDLFDKWTSDGTLDRVLNRLRTMEVDSGDLDFTLWCVDGTSIRAARCAGGGGKKTIQRNRKTTRWAAPGVVSRPRST